ncbi:pilus assembly protein [Nocardioides zeae]|uniref:Pilus assembly protein n=1 Tax=Nocardioides imazamoxiresistens TaxID=3231893 RepID=A0ABU3PQR6_9ACTN|nr:pilus assembly protein [Nocardioides zeae]MDT9591575.1 pilus assembly protein [Nocardioides zeae]
MDSAERASPARGRPRPARDQRGSAVVDFVLVLAVLLPLFVGIVQVALVLHVRNTLTSAASEGARHAAAYDRDLADGAARTREEISRAVAASYAEDVRAEAHSVNGQPGVRVTVVATVPALGLGGPGIELRVHGHAVEETP